MGDLGKKSLLDIISKASTLVQPFPPAIDSNDPKKIKKLVHATKQFVDDIETVVLSSGGLDWEHIRLIIKAKLTGSARSWWDANSARIKSMAEFRQQFLQRFQVSQAEREASFQPMQQNDDVREYDDNFYDAFGEEIAQAGPCMPTVYLRTYLKGLTDELRQAVLLTNAGTLEAARETALQYQARCKGLQPCNSDTMLVSQQPTPGPAHMGRSGYDAAGGRQTGYRWQQQGYQGNAAGYRDNAYPRSAPQQYNNGGTSASRGQIPGTHEDQVRELTRQLEQVKLQLAQASATQPAQPPGRSNTHMVQVVDDHDEECAAARHVTAKASAGGSAPIFAIGGGTGHISSRRPRNLENRTLDTIMEDTENRQPRPAPLAGARRAEEVRAPANHHTILKRVFEGKKFTLSLSEMMQMASPSFQADTAQLFNKACSGGVITETAPTNQLAGAAECVATNAANPAGKTHAHHSQANKGMVTVEVKVNGRTVTGYVDTGAETCVIQRSVAARCGLLSALGSGTRSLQGVSGPPVTSEKVMAHVEMGRARMKVEMLVVDSPTASFELLIGNEFNEAFNMVVDFGDRTLMLDLGAGEVQKLPFSWVRSADCNYSQIQDIVASTHSGGSSGDDSTETCSSEGDSDDDVPGLIDESDWEESDFASSSSASYDSSADNGSSGMSASDQTDSADLDDEDSEGRSEAMPPTPHEQYLKQQLAEIKWDLAHSRHHATQPAPLSYMKGTMAALEERVGELFFLPRRDNPIMFTREALNLTSDYHYVCELRDMMMSRPPQDDDAEFWTMMTRGMQSKTLADDGYAADMPDLRSDSDDDELGHCFHTQPSSESAAFTHRKVEGYPTPFKVGPLLPEHMGIEFDTTMAENRAAFCLSMEDLREPSLVAPQEIRTPGAHPIYQPPYRRPPHEDDITAILVQQMVDVGIVEPSNSAWNSPVLLVRKAVDPAGKPATELAPEEVWRLVVDLRGVNRVTEPDKFPMPLIQDGLEKAAAARVFSKLDLKMGFHQIELDEESRPKTAFSTKSGHWQYRRMAMGLKNSPAAFVRTVNGVLAPAIAKGFAVVYFDDILIFSRTPAEHMQHIREVLQLLAAVKLRAAPHKCAWFISRVKFTGHVLEGGMIRPDPSKISAIQDFPAPVDVPTLQSFLGLVGYYQRHIPDYSTLAYPLRALLRKGADWDWGPDQQQAFLWLKEAMATSPVVYAPDWNKPFLLQTDFSHIAMAAVLSQKDDNNAEHIVSCASRACTKHEAKLSATEGELMALTYGIKYFHYYLSGARFVVETDHNALSFLHNFKDINSKIARVAVLLQSYDFEVVYKRGRLNSNADGLSRVRPLEDNVEQHTLEDALMDLPAVTRTRGLGGGAVLAPVPASSVAVAVEDLSADNPMPCKIFMMQATGSRRSRRLETVPRSPPTLFQIPGVTTSNQVGSGAGRSLGGGDTGNKPSVKPHMSASSSYQEEESSYGSEEDSSDSEEQQHSSSEEEPEKLGPDTKGARASTSAAQQATKPTRLRAPKLDIWADQEALDFLKRPDKFDGGTAKRKELAAKLSKYTWYKGDLFYQDNRLVPAPEHRTSIITKVHNEAGHRGAKSVYDMLAPRYAWADMRRQVETVVAHCEGCREKTFKPIVDPELKPLPLPEFLSRGTMDLMGPLPTSSYGNSRVVVYVDSHSKFVTAGAVPDKKPGSVAKFLRDRVFCTFGVPMEINCDRGGEFEGDVKAECDLQGIKLTKGSAYHPQSQGLAERTVRTLTLGLQSYAASDAPGDWEDHLPKCVTGMNMTKQRTTGFSPFFITFGVQPRLPVGILDSSKLDVAAETEEDNNQQKITEDLAARTEALNEAHGQLVANVKRAQRRQKKEYAARRKTTTSLPPVGTHVWVLKDRGTSMTPKLEGLQKWTGPFMLAGYSEDRKRAILVTKDGSGWTEEWKFITTTPMQNKAAEDEQSGKKRCKLSDE